jgi:hypothetical protein
VPAVTSPIGRGVDYAPLSLPRRYPRITHVEGSVAWAASTTSNPLRIDQSGLLLGLLCTASFLVTSGTSVPVKNSTAPYGLIQKVILATGGGVGRSFDLSAYQLNAVERARDADYLDDPVTTLTASTQTTWTFAFYIPVCVRDGDIYSGYSDYIGAIYTGDPEVTCNFQVVWGAGTDIFSTVNGAVVNSGTLTVSSFKLDVPTPDRDPMIAAAISWVHMIVQDFVLTPTATGPLSGILLPTAEPRVYLRHCLTMFNNGAYANGIISFWDLNLQDYLHFMESVPEQVLLEQQLKRYNLALPVGTYVADFAVADVRTQWLPVDKVTLFKSIPTITSGLSLVSARAEVINESLVPSPLARKWLGRMNPQQAVAA